MLVMWSLICQKAMQKQIWSHSLDVPRSDCFWTHPYTVCVTSDGGEGAEKESSRLTSDSTNGF